MRHDEVTEYAALYALGALDDDLRASIDEHAFACDRCARVLGQAEHDVTVIASTERRHEVPPELAGRIHRMLVREEVPSIPVRRLARTRSPWVSSFAAVAAAFVIGVLPSLYFWQQSRAMHDTMLADSAAIGRVASMPHRMVAFEEMNGGRAQAKVMYARDGSWYVVLVQDVSKTLQVAWMHDGQRTMLGNAVPHGEVAMLYLPNSHRMDHLALMDGEQIVAVANLAY
jgi:anti-sigma factor RsiW